MSGNPVSEARGPISWMVHNRVTPNLLMIFFVLGGLFMTTRIKQEVFPEFDLDMVTVSVSYSGASPEEVEQGIILVVEEAIRSIDGVKELTATATEGKGTVSAELEEDADQQKIYQEIKQEIDRITTFPEDADEPEVSLVTHLREVLDINLYGNVTEMALRETADQVRDRLLQNAQITQVDLAGIRDYEILVEVSQERLRAYGLTLAGIATTINSASTEIPGGSVDTAGGDILLRIKDRRDWAHEFARIPIVTTAEGSVVYLEDIATVREGFEETDQFATYNGQRAIGVDVYRVGDQTPIGVAEAVRTAMEEIEQDLPAGIHWHISRDQSEVYQQRLELLMKNAFMGLALVLVVLGLFLEFKLAFWVTMGIPTAFLGSLLFLPVVGVSINMISMFAFIIALGIVVDDAIVAGENIYEYQQQGMGFSQAAVLGARDVAVPITFSILTNVVAFLPLSFIPGTMGKIWKVVPLVVITVFLISWVESLLILPGHLAHIKRRPAGRFTSRLHRWQQGFTNQVARFINRVYDPFLYLCIRWRTLTVALCLTVLIVLVSYALSGRIGIILMPRVESDHADVTAVLPVGSPMEKVAAVQEKLSTAMNTVASENGGDQLLKGIFSKIEENQVEVRAYLTDVGVRPLNTGEVTRLWREKLGPVVGLESLRFESDGGGPGSGAALTIELSHSDIQVLDQASAALAEGLGEFSNVKDIDDGYTPGKQQLDFSIRPEGQSLGLTSAEVARQVRNAFSGAEALSQQRGRNEVTVRVRLPENERTSEYNVEHLMIQTPAGIFVPLAEIATVERGRAYTSISRRDARRTVTVSADVEPMGETGQVQAALNSTLLPELAREYPGLSYGYQGRQADMKESMQSLIGGFVLSMMAIYFLLAIPFRSYTQPLIVMVAIPFGIVGAILGHLLMGYNLSLMSMMGIVALAGVVVNDSLVLIDYANRQRHEGLGAMDAIHIAGLRRFRPIILTTLTTFGGLAPMIFETSRQARFMIPMALSLGFGILFSTVITLVLVPCLYLLIEDVHQLLGQGDKHLSAHGTDMADKQDALTPAE
ncbi:putative H+-transporting two-sector ATPase, gamma subunit (AcrC-family protein) [Desulforapulum autotrophicum HRM2]|uniref:H+-transporting two-sector ATPase, gamma subunit (AcrC-family protein) n=1 Tax=Desulforapulum autotrophicum (strain ATCC 43914 / DSM 3382 / VKM B-1955 / HRM2) TaxID=177437 RepID=C0QE96_DESAH|nr:efflux RND transporter permease subunit [Desulforapulum autotrophicum]ACN13213.1 putative H+-transporting two-sector ATPase, gamma subunit (AcrC-family protein) [Desulforapulum autotrophicum HRM2]